MAKKTKRLSVRLTDKEQIWAIVYLLFTYFLLPGFQQCSVNVARYKLYHIYTSAILILLCYFII